MMEACGACAHDLQLDEVVTSLKPEEILERAQTVRDNMGGTSPRPKPRRNILGRVIGEDADDRA